MDEAEAKKMKEEASAKAKKDQDAKQKILKEATTK